MLGETYECPLHEGAYTNTQILELEADDLLFFTTTQEQNVSIIVEISCIILDSLNRIIRELSLGWTLIRPDISQLSSDISDLSKKSFTVSKQTISV